MKRLTILTLCFIILSSSFVTSNQFLQGGDLQKETGMGEKVASTAVTGILRGAVSLLETTFNGSIAILLTGIENGAELLIDRDVIKTDKDVLREKLKDFRRKFNNKLEDILQPVKDNTGVAGRGITSALFIVGKLAAETISGLNTLYQETKKVYKEEKNLDQAYEEAKAFMLKSFNQASDLLTNALKNAPEQILESLSNAKQAASTYINKVAPNISKIYNEGLSWLSKKIEGFKFGGFFEKYFGVTEEEADQEDVPYY